MPREDASFAIPYAGPDLDRAPRWVYAVIAAQLLTPLVAAFVARGISNYLLRGWGPVWRSVPGQHDRYSWLAGDVPFFGGVVVLLAATGFGLFRCFRARRFVYAGFIAACGCTCFVVLLFAILLAAPHIF